MFKNANRMKDYATIISYLETCNRNGISRFKSSKRLVSSNPYTIKELENISKKRRLMFFFWRVIIYLTKKIRK